MVMAANICCPIEMEPKTLNQGQLNFAREVAAGVIQKMEPNEAAVIFNEGLRAIIPVKELEGINEKEDEDEDDEEKGQSLGIPCQCSSSSVADVDSPDLVNNPKQPFTAPF